MFSTPWTKVLLRGLEQDLSVGEMLTVYFGAPNMFITLLIWAWLWNWPATRHTNDITSSSSYVHLEVLHFCRKTWTKRTESQQVQRSKWGVPFVFKCMMKSLPKVARTEVSWRNIPEDWSIKDRTSWENTLYLGREDHIVKMMQLKGAKCKMSKGSTGEKGWLNQAGMDLGRSAQAGRPGPFPWWFSPPFLGCEDDATLSTWRRRHSQGESHSPERPSTS
jgi:hypothetical protein